ncbi:MAG: ATP-binding protein [Acetivibrionales bacterium]
MIKNCSLKVKVLIIILIILTPLVVFRTVHLFVNFQSIEMMRILSSEANNRHLYIELAGIGIMTLVSLVIAYALVDCLLRPISDLQKASKKFLEGDYSARAYVNSQDEIGLTAEAFNKMADNIEARSKGSHNFFTNVFHEFKTPLNVIFSSIQLVDSYKKNLDCEEYKKKVSRQMRIIRQNCFRIMRLTSNFIDLNRHDNGFLRINPGNYDIVKLIKDITFSVKRYIESKGINLLFESSIQSRIIACDPDIIERIILNLISNAIKFTDEDGTITVRISEQENNIIFSVSDTGTGIPEDKINKLFNLFSQEDYTIRNKEGSGIGLYLVKAFVEAHNGEIKVINKKPVGTTFEIILPVRVLDEDIYLPLDQFSEKKKQPSISGNLVDRINIEFSDIYSCYDEEIP